MNDIDWGYWLMEIGAWIISFALTFGLFAGLLWCLAWIVDRGERK